LTYPDSSAIPCDLVTMDPTNSPSQRPSTPPTPFPTEPPTSAPTFYSPEVSFVQTNVLSGEISYNCLEGDENGVEVQISLSPAALLPVPVNWQILNSEGEPISNGFNQTSGTVSVSNYKKNYKSKSPACTEPEGECIEGYDCVSHLGTDYCVKDVGETVYEKIYLYAYNDGISNNGYEAFKLQFSPPGKYSNNEFYSNASHYSISLDNYYANIMLYDAESAAFCLVSPGSRSCLGDEGGFLLEWWHWTIIVLLCLSLTIALYCARKKHADAKRAKRAKQVAEEALRNEVIIAEEGLEAGTQIQMNPLARTGLKKKRTKAAKVEPVETLEGQDTEGNEFLGLKHQYRPQSTNEAFEVQ